VIKLVNLGVAEMDHTHQEFVEILEQMQTLIGSEFQQGFIELAEHTERHFSHELELMRESNFPALGEHKADHERILGQLTQFRSRVVQGRIQLVQAFVKEQMPSWFETHLATMDSALAAHLKAFKA